MIFYRNMAGNCKESIFLIQIFLLRNKINQGKTLIAEKMNPTSNVKIGKHCILRSAIHCYDKLDQRETLHIKKCNSLL